MVAQEAAHEGVPGVPRDCPRIWTIVKRRVGSDTLVEALDSSVC